MPPSVRAEAVLQNFHKIQGTKNKEQIADYRLARKRRKMQTAKLLKKSKRAKQYRLQSCSEKGEIKD